METNYKVYKVFSLKIARALIDQGFNFIGTEPNAQYPKFNVYIFEVTDGFMDAFEALKREASANA